MENFIWFFPFVSSYYVIPHDRRLRTSSLVSYCCGCSLLYLFCTTSPSFRCPSRLYLYHFVTTNQNIDVCNHSETCFGNRRIKKTHDKWNRQFIFRTDIKILMSWHYMGQFRCTDRSIRMWSRLIIFDLYKFIVYPLIINTVPFLLIL